ncbi:MAG TPA: sigma-70 family RNA polymerase sigma factor [Gemmatimonadaceae bacterium]
MVFRVRAGDEAAFEQLYLAYHDRLWKFAYGEVRVSEIAEELVQDVFLALWRDRARWDVRTSVRAWLYAAVRHHARNHRRHERVAARFRDQVTASSNDQPATSEDGGTCMGNTAPGAQVAMEAKELDEAVVRAVAALPERRRIAMTLRWKHDLSAAEIAQVLDTTPEAVRVLLTRARQELGGLRELARG